jgi:hypothetical protein
MIGATRFHFMRELVFKRDELIRPVVPLEMHVFLHTLMP